MMRSLSMWLRTDRGRTHVRYVLASAVSVVVGQAILAIGFGVFYWSGGIANLVAFVLAGYLSYVLHRRWTWGRAGRSRVLREVVPFWLLAISGLVLSTVAVSATEAVAPRWTGVRLLQTLLVMGASLVAFGAVWAVKFVIFDRFMFGNRSTSAEAGSVSGER